MFNYCSHPEVPWKPMQKKCELAVNYNWSRALDVLTTRWPLPQLHKLWEVDKLKNKNIKNCPISGEKPMPKKIILGSFYMTKGGNQM